jgi:hypothetical protein
MAQSEGRHAALRAACVVAVTVSIAGVALAADPPAPRVTCTSKPGERQHCPADTSKGVVLAQSSGKAPCLLGQTWGYDQKGIWVNEGCSATFVLGRPVSGEAKMPEEQTPEEKKRFLEYLPSVGFRVYESDKGQIYVRVYSYLRYLNQNGLDPTYVDSFGTTKSVQIREDVQLNKVFIPFSGWFLDPKIRYYLWFWTSNAAAGEGGQVVGGGSLSYVFNDLITLGGGLGALPTVRSNENQFPYWLGVDDRTMADEFFRGSYTMGIWIRGKLPASLSYAVMLGNNLSNLGISAAQLSTGLNTQSFQLAWTPTTGEFGYLGSFGDYEQHQKVATRLGAHYTHSREDAQNQSNPNSVDNSQTRLTDGNIVFNRDLFGPGISVDRVTYEMATVDAGIKYKGFALEAEYFWRKLSNFAGPNTGGIANIEDHGYQIQASAMVVPKFVQAYLSGSEVRGPYGNGSEFRAGANWYVKGERGVRVNAEWIHLNNCPTGYTAIPLTVGANGDVFHANFELGF